MFLCINWFKILEILALNIMLNFIVWFLKSFFWRIKKIKSFKIKRICKYFKFSFKKLSKENVMFLLNIKIIFIIKFL